MVGIPSGRPFSVRKSVFYRRASAVAIFYMLQTVTALGATPTPAPSISPVSVSETTNFPTGLIQPSAGEAASFSPAPLPFAGELPQAHMLSGLPTAGDQGSLNSCVAWALAYNAFTLLEARQRHWSLSDLNHVFSPDFLYNSLDGGQNTGLDIATAMHFAEKTGLATLATMPLSSDYVSQPSPAAQQEAQQYRLSDYQTVFDYRSGTPVSKAPDLIRAQLNSDHPVIVGLEIENAWSSKSQPLSDWTNFVLTNGHSQHAVTLIGYDDIRSIGNDKGGFEFANSWGDTWGNHGTGWISYAAIAAGALVVAYIEVPALPSFSAAGGYEIAASQLVTGVSLTVSHVSNGMVLPGIGTAMQIDGLVTIPAGLTGNVKVVVKLYADNSGQPGDLIHGVNDPTYIDPSDGSAATVSIDMTVPENGLNEQTWTAVLPYEDLALKHGIYEVAGAIVAVPIHYSVFALPVVFLDGYVLKTGTGYRTGFSI